MGVTPARVQWLWLLGCCCACTARSSDVKQPAPSWAHVLDHGSVRGFPSYQEATDLLDGFLARSPHLLTRRRIGSSYQERPIYAYVLGAAQGAEAGERRPQVLLTALMHAREPASLTVLLYFLGHLLELHEAGDPQASYLLDTREVWLVPFVNPDGYIANEDLKVKSIRKNQRPTCGRSADSGVDLNRNFGVHWSPDFKPCNEEFQGGSPFSEPETQAIRKICEENSFKAAMNFHSFGGMLTHPMNWARKPKLPKDDQMVYDEIADVFGWPRFGPAINTVGYTASGESDDWMYGTHDIISMSPEVGPERGDFWPPREEIAGIDRRNYDRIAYVLGKSGLQLGGAWAFQPGAGDHGRANLTALAGGPPSSHLELKLANQGLSTSAGKSIGLALDGVATARPAQSPPGASAMLVAEGLAPFPALPSSGGSDRLAFHLPPLSRRSASVLKLFVGRALEHPARASGQRHLRLCVAEGAAPDVCHCTGVSDLPAASEGEAANGGFGPFKQVLARESSGGADAAHAGELGPLCAAASAAAGHITAKLGAGVPAQASAVPTAAGSAWARTSSDPGTGEAAVLGVLVTACLTLGLCVSGSRQWLQQRRDQPLQLQQLLPCRSSDPPMEADPWDL